MSLDGADGRWDVPTAEALKRLVTEPLPLGLRGGTPTRGFMRDIYYDTSDAALKARGVSCRVRHTSDDRHELTVAVVTEHAGQSLITRADSNIPAGDVRAALDATNDATRLLRSIVNPASLGPHLELEIERQLRPATKGWLRPARFELEYASVTVRAAELARSFHEISLQTLRRGQPSPERVARAIGEFYGLRSVTHDRRERGEQIRSALESEALARKIGGGRWIAVIALDGPFVAALSDGSRWKLPLAEGSGEEACRLTMRRALGSSVGDLRLLSTTEGEGRLRSLEVWIVTHVDRGTTKGGDPALTWAPIEEMLARIGTAQIQDAGTLAALALLSRSELLPSLVALPSAGKLEARAQKRRDATATEGPVRQDAAGPILDSEASLLSFNERVLALAEDESVPLLERVRYLAIVASNMDEFFAVRVGGLKFSGQEVADESSDATSADVRLAQVARQTRALLVRQYACLDACLRALRPQGVRLRSIAELTDAERETLRGYFRSTIFAYLTPRAVTATPGHSLPVVADKGLCFAVMLREGAGTGPQHLAELAIPATLPRFVQLSGANDLIPVEEVIRFALPLMYPGRRVEQAHLFRVTRYADLGVDEQRAGNLAQAVQERTQQRRHQPIVRIEVEQGMPNAMRELLLRELQLEPGARPGGFGVNDVFDIPGLMDLEGLRQLADLPLPGEGLTFAAMRPRRAFADDQPLWETLRDHDVLLHHPYDDFASSVVRFFEEAAADPDVAAIKVALYRAGSRSPIVDALLQAAKGGKDVTVFVELKARFDEQRNVQWMKTLESAGAHVVHGLPGFKNHSKIALVVRRERDGPRRYAHVGTGNYNAATARVYTDLGVLTSRDDICDDVTDLFNTLTGSSVPADVRYQSCLVAPNELLPGLIKRIEREAEHARGGRAARIRLKVNGLSDREVVQALYRASQDGVTIDLVVRGICTLAPRLAGISERIRVVSLLGRFLEHARIFAFDNAGDPEYFIGSADLRPRNLRRRVEVLVPIRAASDRARLDAILDAELSDPTAWELNGDGTYTRTHLTSANGSSAQARFAAAAASQAEVAV
ncbi:MAG TPA: polyphosphate kinase 1 [Gemmatimonadaceae bacterium]|nr:polyphosphate kinase 1 [Gemmatimonadaceae bacterium]